MLERSLQRRKRRTPEDSVTYTHRMKWCTTFLPCLVLTLQAGSFGQQTSNGAPSKRDAELRARIAASPELPFTGVHLRVQPPSEGWQSGAVSGVAVSADGSIYELQRGDKADPVLKLNSAGTLLRSWGKGNYKVPHTIRLDSAGNVWTVDAGSSKVIEYSQDGKKLQTISVGLPEGKAGPFAGATDIAFGPEGTVFVTDGYVNARVTQYTRQGRKISQWGRRGSAPGEFQLPHALQIDENGRIYVADRENGRIEEFDASGKYAGEIVNLGRIYALTLAGNVIWASVGSFDRDPGSGGGWVVKLDRNTGAILGHIDVSAERAGHALDLLPSGEPVITAGNELLWFRAR